MLRKRSYAIYDVFTDEALSGNPLAVVFDSDGLGSNQMQRIAAEFNLSETIFILPAEQAGSRARLRIFMPTGELPFAGHPTVGGTIAICERAGEGVEQNFILEEQVGLLACRYLPGQTAYAQFKLPVLPQREELMMPVDAAADALGINVGDIGFDDHRVSQWNAGKSYLCIPVKNTELLARTTFNEALWLSHFPGVDPLEIDCPYIYCRREEDDFASIQARMFAPHHGIREDPATGSAAASLCGALQLFDRCETGLVKYEIDQGVEMGRPSRIFVEIEISGDTIKSAQIGGNAVKVAEGFLFA